MDHVAKRYTKLGQAYTQLADRFQTLDVEHMNLKRQLLPILKALEVYKQKVAQLEQQNGQLVAANGQLSAELQDVTEKYEALKALEGLLTPEMLSVLDEAEGQMALVEETIQEMDQDSDPDLDEAEKALLVEYGNNPAYFTALENGSVSGAVQATLESNGDLHLPQGVVLSVH